MIEYPTVARDIDLGSVGVMRRGKQDTERTPDWKSLHDSPEFLSLVRAKRRFIIPATIFFLVWYLLLPLGNGLAPALMKTRVIGNVNVAYLFAASQFLVTWGITYLYLRRASHLFDNLADSVRRRIAGTLA